MKKVVLFFLIFGLIAGDVLAQKGQGTVVLVQGKALEYRTNEPLQINFFLVSSSGKKIPVKSGNDGGFQIPISQSDSYRILANDWICREPKMIEITINNSYSERNINLFFEYFKEDLELGKSFAFLPHQFELQPEGKSLLDEIILYNKISPQVFFRINIATDDSYFSKITRTEKIGKKKKKIVITEQQQAQELASSRVQSIRDYLANKLPERNYEIVTLEHRNINAPSKQSKDRKSTTKRMAISPTSPNMIIVITKMMNLGPKSR
jgi:hypothetical protein